MGRKLTVLQLDFDVDTSRQLNALQAVNRLGIWLDDVDKTLVNTHFKMLTGVFVNVRPTNHRVTVLIGR